MTNAEVLTQYIESCLQSARNMKAKEIALIFENQAFGAVNLYARLMWNFDEPEAEAWAVQQWNEVWGPQFTALH